MNEKKKYWLKLDKNFLKSPQIKVIKNMANGKDYIIFYLSLMLESIETIGHLRFSDSVPYSEEMLASVTDTNVDVVRTAIKIFKEIGLIEILESGTIYVPEVPKLVGKESESAERVRKYRLKQCEMLQFNANVTECNANVTKCNIDVTKSNDNKEKDKDKQEDKDKDKYKYKEKNKDKYKENIYYNTTTNNIINYIEKNFGRTITPIELEMLNCWLSLSFNKKDLENIINYAIKISVINNKKTFRYINGILNNWVGCSYKTLKDIKDNEQKKEKIEITNEEEEIINYNWLDED